MTRLENIKLILENYKALNIQEKDPIDERLKNLEKRTVEMQIGVLVGSFQVKQKYFQYFLEYSLLKARVERVKCKLDLIEYFIKKNLS